MNIVLFGKNGQLGWEFQRSLPILGNVVSLDREDLDLCNLDAVQKALRELEPDLIVRYASAYADVDGAEKDPELAMRKSMHWRRRHG
jgi:dTDP-4-dehydrorhamnose reductase